MHGKKDNIKNTETHVRTHTHDSDDTCEVRESFNVYTFGFRNRKFLYRGLALATSWHACGHCTVTLCSSYFQISLKKSFDFCNLVKWGYPVKESKQGGDIDGKDICGGAWGKVIQMQILQDPLGSCWRSCLSSTF